MYASLVDGTYDCVDRIVLNAFFDSHKVLRDFDSGEGSCMEPTTTSTMLI